MPTKLHSKLKQQEFYCVSCRARKSVKADNICVKKYKNRVARDGYTPALRGQCAKCGTNLTKFIKYTDEAKLTKKFGKC